MIWNEKILFLHMPKSAGMSITDLLLNHLKGKIMITVDPKEKLDVIDGVTYILGKKHENLYDAESYFTYINKSIFDFEKIFVVIRNPYDLEVSRYYQLRKGLPFDKGPAQHIALSRSFKEYLAEAHFFAQNPPRLDKFLNMGGVVPSNLIVLRFENIINDVSYFSPYLDNKNILLKKLNESNKKLGDITYDAETEQLCYLRHRWFFDKGYYSRNRF